MYHDFDYYSLIQNGPLEDDRWIELPDGESCQPEELFTRSFVADPEIPTPEDSFWLVLADIMICLVKNEKDDLETRFAVWEQAVIKYEIPMSKALFHGNYKLFAQAMERRKNGYYAAAEYAFRLLSIAGYGAARVELGTMIRRGETSHTYTKVDAMRLLREGVHSGDIISVMHGILLSVPPLNSEEDDWEITEQMIRAITPAGACEIREHWYNWDLCGYIEGPLVHFLLMLFGKIEVPEGTGFSDLYRQVEYYFPSIKYLVNDRKNLRFWDSKGKEWKVLLTVERWGNEYVVYTDHSYSADGTVRLCAGRTHPEDGWHGMCRIESKREQKLVQKAVERWLHTETTEKTEYEA